MEQLFNFDLEKISNISQKESLERKKNLKFFLDTGFPNKKDENWKFSDLNAIISKNFKKITNNIDLSLNKNIDDIKDFEHNKIILVNGFLQSSDIKYENKEKVKIESLKEFSYHSKDNLSFLNKALSSGGFNLEILKNYKCKRPIVIYNYFNSNLENKIINNSNKIKLNQNSELILIEYNICENSKFLKNTFEKVDLDKDSTFKNIMIQKTKSDGYFYKHLYGTQELNSNFQNFILTSGLKFNKVEIDMNLKKENSSCFILSGLCLGNGEHQEIKTKINHLAPNCKSYQKIKNVLEKDSNGVYQGKIYVKDIAQKTNAYQLSKALLLSENSEFNSKPELEIYADDVKCSHGSTSGSVDENSIHYLMTRGLSKKQAVQLLVNGFLNEIIGDIKSNSVRKFIENKIEIQIHGY